MYTSIQTKLMKIKESTNVSITSPSQVAQQCKEISEISQEAFQIITLNTKRKMIDKHLVSLGILNASLIHPREVFKPCLIDSAHALILVHNHPSGDLTPSAEDIIITKKLIEAGNILQIHPLDHIIIAKQNGQLKFLSMREEGIVQFFS